MENNIKKPCLKTRTMKDAGDVRKFFRTVSSGSYVLEPNEAGDRGDTVTKTGLEKIKISDKKLAEIPAKNAEKTNRARPTAKDSDRRVVFPRDEYHTKDLQAKIAEMKRIREKYTFRIKKVNGDSLKETSDMKVETENDLTRLNEQMKLISRADRETSPKDNLYSISSQKESKRDSSDKTETKNKIPLKNAPSLQRIRRPIIKTITATNDKTKVYKSVNFVDKKAQLTRLTISIPIDMKKERNTKPAQSKANLKEKRKRDKKRRSFRSPPASPEVAVRIRSPPTEVAKWATADNHKKLYYEAWVDTTLAAISKKVKDKKIDKHALIENLKKALSERPLSPDIDYKMLLDEKYTGKIKVHKR